VGGESWGKAGIIEKLRGFLIFGGQLRKSLKIKPIISSIEKHFSLFPSFKTLLKTTQLLIKSCFIEL
jgi:hypothetical protein